MSLFSGKQCCQPVGEDVQVPDDELSLTPRQSVHRSLSEAEEKGELEKSSTSSSCFRQRGGRVLTRSWREGKISPRAA